MFKSRSLLLRGTLLSLWRRETEAMNDLRSVLSLPDVPSEVSPCILYFYLMPITIATGRYPYKDSCYIRWASSSEGMLRGV